VAEKEKNIITKSETICPFPWMHLHAWPDGKAMLCCVANGGDNIGEVGDFSTNSYKEIINNDKLKQIRLDMMAGKQVKYCQSCYAHEKLDGQQQSFRQGSLHTYQDVFESLLEDTEEDGTLKNPKLLYMDFRFSNLCNLGCQTCGGQLSSTLANNDVLQNRYPHRHAELINKGVLSERGTITSFVYARPNFMQEDVYQYIDEVRGFYFAGGEPLMSKEHLDILMYLDENKLYNKSITYSTNLSLLKWKKKDFIPIWEKFDHIHFLCSIDGQGKILEYTREYSKHDIIFSNLRTLIDSRKKIKKHRISIIYTHSIYNCYNTAEFFEYLDSSGFLDDLDNCIFNQAFGNENSLKNLPDFAKKELIQKREHDRLNSSVQKAFKLFPDFETYWNLIGDTIEEERDEKIFRSLSLKNMNPANEKFKENMPWLYNVITRQYIV